MISTRIAGLAAFLVSTAPAFAQAPAAGAPNATQVATRIDARVKDLHDQLHITAAEEQNWQAFAAVMKQNMQETATAMASREQSFSGMNAVQDLQSYAELQQEEGQRMSRLVAPFQTLYAQFSPEQKQSADQIFHARTARGAARPRG